MKKTNLFALLFLPVTALLSFGCMKDNTEEIKFLNEKVNALEDQLKTIQSEKELDDLIKKGDQVAYLRPGSEGYSVLDFDLGKITVSLENISSYANGSKVQLRFGNISQATLNGVEADIDWGSVDEKGIRNRETERTKEYKFSRNFSSGSWNKVFVILEDIPPSKLGYVRIRNIRHTGISLRTD